MLAVRQGDRLRAGSVIFGLRRLPVRSRFRTPDAADCFAGDGLSRRSALSGVSRRGPSMFRLRPHADYAGDRDQSRRRGVRRCRTECSRSRSARPDAHTIVFGNISTHCLNGAFVFASMTDALTQATAPGASSATTSCRRCRRLPSSLCRAVAPAPASPGARRGRKSISLQRRR